MFVALQAGGWLSFQQPGVISACWDAFRQGKPAKGWLEVAASEGQKDRHAALPPEDWFPIMGSQGFDFLYYGPHGGHASWPYW